MALDAYYNLKERKKRNILDAISNCLKIKNYDDLTVNDIAVAADISRGSFYNYFVDKNDAITTLVGSRIKDYFDKYIEAIKQSNYSLIDGTKLIYNRIKDVLNDEIIFLKMRNMKFFIEFVFQSVHSEKFVNDIDEIIDWLLKNTNEGKLNSMTHKKMANVLDMLIVLVLSTLFSQIMFNSDWFKMYDDFEYKLGIISNSINI